MAVLLHYLTPSTIFLSQKRRKPEKKPTGFHLGFLGPQNGQQRTKHATAYLNEHSMHWHRISRICICAAIRSIFCQTLTTKADGHKHPPASGTRSVYSFPNRGGDAVSGDTHSPVPLANALGTTGRRHCLMHCSSQTNVDTT